MRTPPLRLSHLARTVSAYIRSRSAAPAASLRLGGSAGAPPSDMVISRRFPCSTDQVAKARRFVGELLGEHHPAQEIAILLTSELATNAIQHGSCGGEGGAPSFLVLVLVSRDNARALVAVLDRGSNKVPYLRNGGPDSTGGRGISLVDQLSARWGFTRDISKGSTGVWFEVGPREYVQESPRCICQLLIQIRP
ncbi:ATP-binding protein [Sphaerisporangium sp. NPDC088356]|uniref:ATP-binding protein n=1 Tax=Sphaerisporangium sp. NPDC088356 TaxID=3154871 RepID=UPI00343761FE